MRTILAIITALMLSGSAVPAEDAGLRVRLLRVGPGAVSGRLLSIQGEQLRLLRDGTEAALPLEEFREIIFTGRAPSPVTPRLKLWLADGTVLLAHRLEPGAGPETLTVNGYGWTASGLPLTRLRALATRRFLASASREQRETFREARREPPTAADRVAAYGETGLFTSTGILQRMGPDALHLSEAEASRTLPWEDVAWLVPAPLDEADGDRPGHVLELASGSRIVASGLALDKTQAVARDSPVRYVIQPDRLRRVRLGVGSYRYLSDLAPVEVRKQPLLDVTWEPRFDASVTGDPLRLDGEEYPRGIGMHTRTEMTFELPGQYDRFHAVVGVDDAAEERGSAVFRVLADGEELYDSDRLGGEDPPRHVSLEIAGARRLTLVADFGDPLSLGGNFADWAEARVARETGSAESPSNSTETPAAR